jgi:branched-chain amino acid transport system permease protein
MSQGREIANTDLAQTETTSLAPGGERVVARRVLRLIGAAMLLVAAIGVPWVMNSQYDLNVLVTMALNASLATGLAIVVRAGRLSLAQATFGGIGGYMSGILTAQFGISYWLALPAAGVTAAAFGLLLGLTSLRLQGFYFAIATFTFSQIAIVVLSAWTSETGGMSGMFGLDNPPDIGPFTFSDPVVYYYFALIILAFVLVVAWLCSTGTRFGRGLTVLGEDETVAGALGVPAISYRLAAFAISSFIGGISGSLNTHFIQGISPSDIAPAVSVFVLVMVMAGGARRLLGPAIGAIILTLIPELLRASAQWSMVLYGLFLLAYVFLFRQGLLPLLDDGIAWVFGLRAGTTMGVTRTVAAPTALPPKPPLESGAAPATTLALEHVRCQFGENLVLNDISLAVTPGALWGIIGPNGAGKTTLFNVITGNAPLTRGRVMLGGHGIRPLPARVARRGVARTFQHPRVLLQHSVRESLAYAAELCGARRDPAYLDWVIDVTRLRPLLDRRGGQLSHYERRLLTIGMAIAGRPKLLLLDEPLAGLDDTETQSVKEQIREIHARLGCTVLLIEHKLAVVMELCSFLTVLDYGRVIAEGDPVSVASNDAVIQAYLGS